MNMGKKGSGGGVFQALVLVVTIAIWCLGAIEALGFKCRSEPATCRAFIDYTSPEDTNYRAIQKLFNIKHLIDIVGANSLPPNTRGSDTVRKSQIIRIPFNCSCRNSTGLSSRHPIYTVQKGDSLSKIAEEVFSRLVTWQQIQEVNNIKDADKIEPGQEFWVPLPCSCDQVDGTQVVHYGHVVASGSTVQQIAQLYGTTQDTLLDLNNMTDPNKLLAGQIFDVPLKACSLSAVKNESLDYGLLVANGTDLYTANGCVKCRCDSANNWTVQCEPSQAKPNNVTCPSMECQISDSLKLLIGNATDSCPQTTCAYDGYTANQTIFTNLVTAPTCPESKASRTNIQGSLFSLVLIAILSLYLH